LPLKYRLLAKTILFLCGFKIYRQRFGDAGFWLITNKPLPKEIHDEDVVFENKNAQKGQIRKAKLICDGEVGRVKCRWVFNVQKD
jgi:hypothetical protein